MLLTFESFVSEDALAHGPEALRFHLLLSFAATQETYRLGSRLERELRGKSYVAMSPPRGSMSGSHHTGGDTYGVDYGDQRAPSRSRGGLLHIPRSLPFG
jgi:hypothetical protein